MKKIQWFYNLTRVAIIVSIMFWGCNPGKDNLNQGKNNAWPEVKNTTKPWTRWWWMGNAVDRKNINSLLKKYSEAGFGGVEITPIYGVAGYENSYLSFLSPEWIEQVRYTIKVAGSEGMGVDMNMGTGWPFGGPQITPQFAASKLILQKYTLMKGQTLKEKLVVEDSTQRNLGVRLIAAIGYNGRTERLNLTDKVSGDGTLKWIPENGNWEIYAAFSGLTGQKVKRAAPGGEGLSMDHFSEKALNTYMKRFDDAFGKKPPKIKAYFNDSYEVYGADFSPEMFKDFEKLKGYDPRLYLKELVSEDTTDMVLRIKADYRETMAHMLLNNFTIPWTNWIHAHKAVSRNQAHGSPGNLLDLYAAVDIPECETFGSTSFSIPGLNKYTVDTRNEPPDPVMLKFASSAGNITGKPLVSAETFTWLGEHFKVSLAQCKPEVEQAFLAGINHIFYHGTTYSPEDADWPGWLFYASVEFVPSNSLWPHVKGLNEYITRCQSVLQSGKPDNELLVYWPVYDAWYHCNPKKLDLQLGVDNLKEWLKPTDFYRTVKDLMNSGYSVDFVSDNLLERAKVTNGQICTKEKGSSYKVLIVPQIDFIPLPTLKRILDLARTGATVIFKQNPLDVPGFKEKDIRKQQMQELISSLIFEKTGNGIQEMKMGSGLVFLSAEVQKVLQLKDINRETLIDSGLKFIRRDIDGDKYYYLVNHTEKMIDSWLILNTEAKSVLIMDPLDGRSGLADATAIKNKVQVRIKMRSGEAIILRTFNKVVKRKYWAYPGQEDEPILMSGKWDLKFMNGGPGIPETQNITKLVSWTDLPDTNSVKFSGTAIYTTTFNLKNKDTEDYLLRLGDVRESARVWINKKDAGILWSVPYELRIGKFLKKGENTLKIEVANLMANRIRDMDRSGVVWRKFHEINFVDLNYEPFDASGWDPQPSGLLGPVSLLPINTP